MPVRKSSAWLLLWAAGVLGAEDKPASVEGTVTNALTGEPLVRAHVSLRGLVDGAPRNLGALTNVEGRFSMANVPPGNFTVTAEHVGFVAYLEPGRPWTQVFLKAGDRKDDLKLKLTPTGAIAGRVAAADGEPAEGVTVFAETGPTGTRAATTDEKGQFRIGGLQPGKYRVKAKAASMPLPPEIRSDGTTEVHYVQTWFPNAISEQGASRVEVRPGAESGGIEIQLQRAPIVRVSGTVSGFPPEARGLVVECRQPRQFGGMSVVKPDRTFEIWRMDPGRYSVSARSNSNGKVLRTAAVEVEVGNANVDHLNLRMVPPSDIAGQLEYDDEQARQPPLQAVPQGVVILQGQAPPAARKPPPLRLMLREAGNGVPPGPQPVEIGADGSFKLEGVQPAKYRVTLSWGSVFIKSMRLGQVPMEGNILDLTGGSNGAPLSVLVSSAVAEVSGVVRNDKGPAAGVRVAMIQPPFSIGTMPAMAMSGADGAYKIGGLAPGKYKLAALEDGALMSMPSIESDYEDVWEAVEVGAGDKLVRDLRSR
jgi:Carboxypeptidase regulatory-like domain